MYKDSLLKGNALFKPLLVLVLSMALLLSGAVLPGKEAKAAPVAPDREVDLATGHVTVKDNEILSVYTNPGEGTAHNIRVPEGVNATVILDNVSFGSDPQNHDPERTWGLLDIGNNARVKVLLKGKTTAIVQRTLGMIVNQQPGSDVTIEDYGNGDGELHLTQGGNGLPYAYYYPALGACGNGASSLTINSGKVVAVSDSLAAAIGVCGDDYGAATLNLTINDPAIVEARTNGQGAAIGTTAGGHVNSTVNATINGGTVTASNSTPSIIGGDYLRVGPVIGAALMLSGEADVTLNIPQSSTAKLNLTAYGGSAAIGTNGDARYDSYGLIGANSKHSTTANINGGTVNITNKGQGPGIGVGAGNGSSSGNIHNVEANIGGGSITISNDLDTEDQKSGDATGPAIGIGLLTQNQTMTCNVTGGNLTMLSQDKGNYLATSPAVGIGAMNKNNATTSKWTQSKNNTVNFNVTGGNVVAETRSTDRDIMDVGAIENNKLNVKVDGGSFNVVNGRMNVTAQNSNADNVYPATVSLGNMTSSTSTVSSATIDGKSYGSDLMTQDGKLYLWTTPGTDKKINATVSGVSRSYSNPGANLDYSSGFTFTEPNVTVKKTATSADLGRLSASSAGDDSVTVQVSSVASDVPVAVQAFDPATGQAVGSAQNYSSGKTDYTLTGLSKNKIYNVKTFASDQANFWAAESAPILVKPFVYASELELADAELKGDYAASVALDSGNFTYALASGSAVPDGLKFTSDGRISGKATATGTYHFDVIATATDEGIAAGNARTATVTLNVVPITVESSVVDALGQTLEGCDCRIESKSANEEIAVGDTVLYTATACGQHGFVKFNLNGIDYTTASGVKVVDGVATYSYVVKSGDKHLVMKAYMEDLRVTKLEMAGEAPNIDLFANAEANVSADALQSYVDNNVTLKATYHDGTTRNAKASALGFDWATNDAYDIKGGSYHFTVGSGSTYVEQNMTVKPVTLELVPLQGVVRMMNDKEGYPSIEALGLPETVDCQYPSEVTVSEADHKAAISWTTEVPQDFGKRPTSAPVVFEGTAAVPEWATIESNAVSVNVSISDKVFLTPQITIEDKVYDGTRDAVIADTPTLDPESLTVGADVQLEGTAIARFKSTDVGQNLEVAISGLALTGADADNYFLDFAGITGNIIPATISLEGITMEDKTVTENGNVQTIDVKGTLPEGVSVSYTYLKEGESEAVEQAPSAAGTYTVTAAFKTDANHVVEPETMSATLVIEGKIPVLVKGITIEDKTYDGTRDAVITGTPTLDPESLKEGDDVRLEGQAAAEFSSADVGQNIPVEISGLTLTGVDADKYSLDLSQVTGNIVKKAIDVAPEAGQTKVFGSNDPNSYGFAVSEETPLVGDDKLLDVLTRAEGEDVGEYAYSLTPSAAEHTHYTITLKDADTIKFTITKATPAAPVMPVLKDSTSDTVTLETIEVTDAVAIKAGAAVEYGLIEGDNQTKWQAEPVFEGLEGDTAYRFTARYAATKNTEASAESKVLEVKTPAGGIVVKAPAVTGVPEGTEGIAVTADKLDQAVKAGDEIVFTLTGNKAKEGSYVPYGFTINGEAVEVGKMDAETRSCTVTYTVQDADVEKGSLDAEALFTQLGNINTDDKINGIDALLIQRAAAGLGDPLSEEKAVAADVNMDGKMNGIDALLIKRYVAGLSEAL